MATAIKRMREMRPDLRYHRAVQLTAAVFREIEGAVPCDDHREIHDKLLKLFHDNGWSIMTDEDRRDNGLEPRDDFGWTPSERVRHEQLRTQAMLQMANLKFETD